MLSYCCARHGSTSIKQINLPSGMSTAVAASIPIKPIRTGAIEPFVIPPLGTGRGGSNAGNLCPRVAEPRQTRGKWTIPEDGSFASPPTNATVTCARRPLIEGCLLPRRHKNSLQIVDLQATQIKREIHCCRGRTRTSTKRLALAQCFVVVNPSRPDRSERHYTMFIP